MVTDSPRPARARSTAEKSQRRQDILDAAERLWAATAYGELSMHDVAREAKLAKGTLYLYFDTKEELFLALLEGHTHAWFRETTARMREAAPQSAQGVADVLLAASDHLAPLRRLLVLLGTVLEHKLRPEQLADFRAGLRPLMDDFLAAMPYCPAVGLRMVRHLYALSLGWQQLTEDIRHDSLTPRPAAWPLREEFEIALRAVIERLAQDNRAADSA